MTKVLSQFDRPPNSLGEWSRAIRIHQWSKNLLLFVPLLVGHAYDDYHVVVSTLIGYFSFCVLSSATYLINDVADLEHDRLHPTKRTRPIASGRLKKEHALI